SVRCLIPKDQQTTTAQSDKLPSYLQSFTHIRPARPSMGSSELGSDAKLNPKGQNPTPGSLQINLLFTMYAEHASAISRCKTLFSSKDKRRQLQHQSIWWS
ncbi:hypothetical protein, partial [Rhizobium leguminosarum]|uniref:hypothetical protein n=1 Tax=Rhizobium leguminosarum TaxID=384 RepID=UPI001980B6FB